MGHGVDVNSLGMAVVCCTYVCERYICTYIHCNGVTCVYTADGTQLAGCSVCSIWFICCYMCMFVRMYAVLRFNSAVGVQFYIVDKWRHLQVRTHHLHVHTSTASHL